MPLFPSKDKRSGYTLLHGHVHLGKRKLMINHWTRTYMTTITIWHSNTIITIIETTIIIILSLTLSYCFTITCCYYWLFTSVVPCFFPLFSTIFSRNSRKSGSSRSSGIFVFVALLTFDHRQDLLFPLFGAVPVGITHLASHSPVKTKRCNLRCVEHLCRYTVHIISYNII